MLSRRWRYPVRPYHGGVETVPPSYDLPVLPTVRHFRQRSLPESGWTYGGVLAHQQHHLRVMCALAGGVVDGPREPAPEPLSPAAAQDRARRERIAAVLAQAHDDLLAEPAYGAANTEAIPTTRQEAS